MSAAYPYSVTLIAMTTIPTITLWLLVTLSSPWGRSQPGKAYVVLERFATVHDCEAMKDALPVQTYRDLTRCIQARVFDTRSPK